MHNLSKSSTIEYNVGFDTPEGIKPFYEDANFPIIFAYRKEFSNILIQRGKVYYEMSTYTIYVGDGLTAGGIQINNLKNFNGIDGGQGSFPKYN